MDITKSCWCGASQTIWLRSSCRTMSGSYMITWCAQKRQKIIPWTMGYQLNTHTQRHPAYTAARQYEWPVLPNIMVTYVHCNCSVATYLSLSGLFKESLRSDHRVFLLDFHWFSLLTVDVLESSSKVATVLWQWYAKLQVSHYFLAWSIYCRWIWRVAIPWSWWRQRYQRKLGWFVMDIWALQMVLQYTNLCYRFDGGS